MAKKDQKELTLRECQEIARRVHVGFEEAVGVAEMCLEEDELVDAGLDGVIGALQACRQSDRMDRPIAWLLGVLTTVTDDRDKAQTVLGLDDDEDGEEG